MRDGLRLSKPDEQREMVRRRHRTANSWSFDAKAKPNIRMGVDTDGTFDGSSSGNHLL